ncbi:hypothetical protein ACC691_36005, partial [Rhizobium johnstonii]|uniref:hypothetical protein n=1 Tax=Rhizobium johnstonii TaxID=3019933 RepID=UPI003F9A2589
VHVQAVDKVGRRSRYGIVWHNHGLRDDDVIDLDGHLVTSLERTLFDLGCSSSRVTSVAAMDFATKPQFQTGLGGTIHGIEKDALFESIRSRGTARGCRSALLAVSFSDNGAGSPAESASRVNIDLAGFPSPQLQTPLPREDGGFDYLDLDWEQFGRFGECDGDGKYVEDRYTKGLTPRQVLKAEKDREDRIRLHRPFGA